MVAIQRSPAISTLSSPALICTARRLPIVKLSPGDLVESYTFVRRLEGYYPGFRSWFAKKVYPGCHLGTRAAFACLNEMQQLVGIAIVKREKGEQKICTLFVEPSYAGRGIGTRLLNTSVTWLEDLSPIITVDESRLGSFGKILTANGFRVTSRILDLYSVGRIEYIFNEKQTSTIDCL